MKMHKHFVLRRSWLCAALLAAFAAPALAAFQTGSSSALPATTSPGNTVTLAASIQSSVAVSNLAVYMEVLNSAGVKMGTSVYRGQNFSAGKAIQYSWQFAAPAAAGTYTFKFGVFTAAFTADLYWHDSAGSFTVTQASNSRGPVPAGLPSTFFVGLAAGPGAQQAWVHSSGVPWAVCYQYISSGVLPGQSWVTQWGTNFAYNYAVASHAAGCIPELTYYQMVPTIGAEGASAEHTALNNAATMADYYKDFTSLMQQLHQYGGPALVHVEPDMFAYLETLNANPALITASVAFSGDSNVAGYPNTVAGFGQALLHLRDLYAPNVIMAAHVSIWLFGGSTNPSIDVTQIARNDAAFMTGLGNWDLFFTDISDRDAAYYQYVVGDGGANWWDATNQKYPNFTRLEPGAGGFTAAAQKR